MEVSCNAEIREHVAISTVGKREAEDVLRLEVAMENLLAMQMLQRRQNIAGNPFPYTGRRRQVLGHELAERAACNVFIYQTRIAIWQVMKIETPNQARMGDGEHGGKLP
jgi:hypothetical protein